MQPTATNSKYQYAVSFSYAVQCKISEIVIDIGGQDSSENTPVTLSGNVDGVMQAKQTPIEILNPAAAPAQEPAVEAADGRLTSASNTRSLLTNN